jgi:hypothetical protein
MNLDIKNQLNNSVYAMNTALEERVEFDVTSIRPDNYAPPLNTAWEPTYDAIRNEDDL